MLHVLGVDKNTTTIMELWSLIVLKYYIPILYHRTTKNFHAEWGFPELPQDGTNLENGREYKNEQEKIKKKIIRTAKN